MIAKAAGTIFRSKSPFRDERAENQPYSHCRVSLSRRFAAVRFQQSAKPLATSNIADPNRLVRIVNARRLDDRLVVERLMGPLFVIVRGKFTAQMVEVLDAEDDEAVGAP